LKSSLQSRCHSFYIASRTILAVDLMTNEVENIQNESPTERI